MGFPVGQPLPIRYYTGTTGQTVLARIVDEVDGAFGAELTLVENAALNALGYPGFYENTWTPDMAGHWKILIKVGGVVYGQLFYHVGQGVGVDVAWYKGYCDAGMGASTTNIVCAGLAGLGDDFFNTDWVMLVNLNINAVGVAPEGQIRDITNYVSATGTFTTVAFGANVEANDCIIVARREFFTVDGVALQAIPTTNSLAYRISQYLATGDGDWVGGTPLPSNQSLYDQHLIPVADVADNVTLSDVVGNKTDTEIYAISADKSVQSYVKGIIHALRAEGIDAVGTTMVKETIGNKGDTPAFFQALTSSLMRYQKAILAASGLSYMGVCDSGMGASQTVIDCDDLAGFGDDFFNTDWVMVIVRNDNAHGAAPEGNYPKDITNYVSATGTFTTVAFGANVEENDIILVIRRELFVIDEVATNTTPVAGSLSHRLMLFLADGDGSGWGGTVLPADTSLYDVVRYLYLIAHPSGDPTADSLLDLIMNKGAGQTFDRAADSLERLGEITLETDTRAGTIITEVEHLYAVTPGAAEPVGGTYLDQLMHKDGAQTFSDTTDSLEAIRDRIDQMVSTEISFTENREVADAVAEIQIWEQQVNTYIRDIFLYSNLDTLETAGEGGIVTIRAYHRVDGAAYSDQPELEINYTVGASNEYPSISLFGVSEWVQVTMQCSVAVTAQRACPFRGSYRRTS